jgi:hypothetical protein
MPSRKRRHPSIAYLTRVRMASRQWSVRYNNSTRDTFDLPITDGLVYRAWRVTDAAALGLPRSPLSPVLMRLVDVTAHETTEVEALTFPSMLAAVRYAEQWRREYLRMMADPAEAEAIVRGTVTRHADGSTTYRNPEPCAPVPERNDVPSHDCA